MSSKTAPKLPNLLKYHRPKLRLNEARIPPLSQESKEWALSTFGLSKPRSIELICVRQMSSKSGSTSHTQDKVNLPEVKMCCSFGSSVRWSKGWSVRLAQSVGALVGRGVIGDYDQVSPSRRSLTLRTYAGDTSLPGGKVDPEDKTLEDTAVSRIYLLIHLLWCSWQT